MLESSAAMSALLLVLVLLPLVVYVLLGKWGGAKAEGERVNLNDQYAAEEKTGVLEMASVAATHLSNSPNIEATVLPFSAPSNSGKHVCARCCAPAKTRCSRCKSIRYWYDHPLFLIMCLFNGVWL